MNPIRRNAIVRARQRKAAALSTYELRCRELAQAHRSGEQTARMAAWRAAHERFVVVVQRKGDWDWRTRRLTIRRVWGRLFRSEAEAWAAISFHDPRHPEGRPKLGKHPDRINSISVEKRIVGTDKRAAG